MDLEEKEQRYRFLLTKLDSEIMTFKNYLDYLKSKKEELSSFASSKSIPAVIKIGSNDADVLSNVEQYLHELENLKQYIAGKLDKVIKQIELKKELDKKYGKKVSLKTGDLPVIVYKDEEIENIDTKLNLSKRLLEELKSKMTD